MKVVTVVGTRPQFVKAAVFSRALIARGHREVLVHTGQHYDASLSEALFDGLAMHPPDVNLNVGSGEHGAQTAAMLTGIEQVVLHQRPDWVIVFGDSNSTLAGALAAAKLNVPIAHIEAGLRSFNRRMPEEINRTMTDRVSSLKFCPSRAAVNHLAAEGMTDGVFLARDLMHEALTHAADRSHDRTAWHERLGVVRKTYIVATVHRAENTDDSARLAAILGALNDLHEPVVLPIHPRTRRAMTQLGHQASSDVRIIDPVGYADMLSLAEGARLIVTDSGGLQKEAYWLGVPCVTMRDETEWVETIEAGWNRLVGASRRAIVDAVVHFRPPPIRPPLYTHGLSSQECVSVLESWMHGVARGD